MNKLILILALALAVPMISSAGDLEDCKEKISKDLLAGLGPAISLHAEIENKAIQAWKQKPKGDEEANGLIVSGQLSGQLSQIYKTLEFWSEEFCSSYLDAKNN